MMIFRSVSPSSEKMAKFHGFFGFEFRILPLTFARSRNKVWG